MRNLKVSLCYYPTTIILVDDDEVYLSQLYNYLKNILPCLPFSDPFKALEYSNSQSQETFIQRCMEQPQDNDEDSKYFSSGVNVRAIQNEIKHHNRFKDVKIFVADYEMPSMSGIEFCSRIQDPNSEKLLLTGVADSDVVIEAFKKRKINNYLKKGVSNLIPVLLNEIISLQKQYFLDLSNILMNQAESKILASLEDQYVADLFNKLSQDNNIVEHYLMNNEGDFLWADRQGKLSRFSIKSIKEIESMYTYAKDENASESVLIALKNKEKIPLFDSTEAIDNTDAFEWEGCLHPIQKVPGSNQYYFAYRKDLAHLPKDLESIVSLEDYLFNPL